MLIHWTPTLYKQKKTTAVSMAAVAEQRWHAALASLAAIRGSDLRHSELRRPRRAVRFATSPSPTKNHWLVVTGLSHIVPVTTNVKFIWSWDYPIKYMIGL